MFGVFSTSVFDIGVSLDPVTWFNLCGVIVFRVIEKSKEIL